MSKEIPRNKIELTHRGKKVVAWIGGIALAAGATLGYNAYTSPNFSEETVTEIAEPGDTLWDIANDVDGSDKFGRDVIITHIKDMPENAETFADGKLDQGEKVVRPVSVE